MRAGMGGPDGEAVVPLRSVEYTFFYESLSVGNLEQY